ncbi:hypothetical protein JSY36_06015 [Bacillus sp. H-16]|uniref:hypothetical protein n=1 Tax=Alteribacter salitolerans TaxID=2912333 RepID=UPI0019653491|nr:hypothetical protein [Alteribacter salitolerans]MBM7095306.1 hypothetical protein [Alteribacter salitolerans]
MRFPKVTTALISIIILSLLMPVILPVFTVDRYVVNVLLYGLFLTPAVFIYGIPASFLADYLSKKAGWKNMRLLSFLIHLIFGLAFIFPYRIFDESVFSHGIINIATVGGLISAGLFFVVHEAVLKVDRMMYGY